MNKKQAKQIVGGVCLLLLAKNEIGAFNQAVIQAYGSITVIRKKQKDDDLSNKVFDFFGMHQVQFSHSSTSSVISMPLISNLS